MDELESWSSLVRAIVATVLVIYVAKCVGAFVAVKATSVHLHIVLGFNLVGLFALVAGQLSQPAPFLCLCFLGLAFLLRDAIRYLKAKRQLTQFGASASPPNALSLWAKAALTISLLITLGPALTYPSGWDELTYHISLPGRWTLAGSISVQQDLPYSALPSLCELVFWIVHPLEALVTPRLITWVIWVEGFLLLNEALRRFSKPANRIAILWMLAASPAMLMVSANCYVEAFVWADVAALCYLWLDKDPGKEQTPRSAIITGLIVGGALATKMTAVGLIVLPVLGWFYDKLSAANRARNIAVCMVITTLFAMPFYLRPWILFGNPLGPYYAAWFTSDAATIESSHYHHDLAVGNFGLPGFIGLPAAPMAIAFANELYDGKFGWQWFGILGLAGVGAMPWRERDRSNRGMHCVWGFSCIALYLIWLVTAQQARFAIPIFAVVAMGAAFGLEKLDLTWQKTARTMLVLTALFSLPWNHTGYYLDSWLCVLKVRSPVDYIRDGVGDAYAELSSHLKINSKSSDKYISLFEHRLTYLPDNVEIATPFFQSKYFRAPENNSAEQIFDELKEHQVTHVIFAHSPVGPDLSARRFELQQNWFRGIDECIAKGYLRVVWKSDLHAVAELQ